MGKMRTGDTNFGTKITDKSGILPKQLDEQYCKEKSLKKILEKKSIIDEWSEEIFEKNYKFFIHKFNKE